MFAAAFKTNVSDGLIAYAAREKGNYFAGTRGADGYRNNPVYEGKDSGHTNTTERMIPNMARFYRPGREVVNSNVSSKSLLLKNNWYLPANQKIALAYMKTRVEFGEHNPFYSNIAQGYSDDFYSIDRASISEQMMPGQGMDSTIQTKSYKLGYAWQPDSPWIDLQANVWRVNTRSTRYQNGAADLYVGSPDDDYDNWRRCSRGEVPPSLENEKMSCQELIAAGKVPAQKPPLLPYDGFNPNSDGYRVKTAAEQRTRATRSGADISNRFRLGSKLDLTISANVQHEKLDEYTESFSQDNDFDNLSGAASGMAALSGPRAGRRHEWGAALAFDWRPTSRLNIQAGIRYDKFWSFDDVLARKRRERKDLFYSILKGYDSYITGAYLPYYELITDKQEVEEKLKLDNYWNYGDRTDEDAWLLEYNRMHQAFEKKYGYDASDIIWRTPQGNNTDDAPDSGRVAFYRKKQAYTPYRNGRFEGPVFRDGMFDEKVQNPAGIKGAYYKYLIKQHADTWMEEGYEYQKREYPVKPYDGNKPAGN